MQLEERSILETCISSREVCTDTYLALRSAKLAAPWLVSVSSLTRLPLCSLRRLFSRRREVAAESFNWASVILCRSLYGCALNGGESCKTMLPHRKNAKQKGCLQCVAFFSPKSFLSEGNYVYLWRYLYCCPKIVHICGTPGLTMRKQTAFGKAYKENLRACVFSQLKCHYCTFLLLQKLVEQNHTLWMLLCNYEVTNLVADMSLRSWCVYFKKSHPT